MVRAYRQEGYDFVRQVCNDSTGGLLEHLSGIAALTAAVGDDDMCFEDDEGDGDDF